MAPPNPDLRDRDTPEATEGEAAPSGVGGALITPAVAARDELDRRERPDPDTEEETFDRLSAIAAVCLTIVQVSSERTTNKVN